jgi:hypothetical protein
MENLAPLDQYGIVCHLLRQRVFEYESDVGKRRLLIDEFATLQNGKEAVYVDFGTIYYVPYERKRKSPTHDERLQQVLLIRTQPVNS